MLIWGRSSAVFGLVRVLAAVCLDPLDLWPLRGEELFDLRRPPIRGRLARLDRRLAVLLLEPGVRDYGGLLGRGDLVGFIEVSSFAEC